MSQWLKQLFSTSKSNTVELNHPQTSSTISFITYNIWFEDHNKANRLPAIFQILEQSDVDFICLQQVTKQFYKHLINCSFSKKYYHSNILDSPYGYDALIMSKFKCDFKKIIFPTSIFGRYLLIAETQINDEKFIVATSHFESIGSNMKERMNQLNISFQALKEYQNVALMGDFNFDSRDKNGKEDECIPKEFRDTYLYIHKRPDCTMPKTCREYEWRPDKILIKTKRYELKAIQRIGNFVIKPYHKQRVEDIQTDGIVRTPSDHFGLHAQIQLK